LLRALDKARVKAAASHLSQSMLKEWGSGRTARRHSRFPLTLRDVEALLFTRSAITNTQVIDTTAPIERLTKINSFVDQ
jgi:hypothetical protein